MTRIFVGFFGLPRAFEYTIESIEQNIYAPLAQPGIDVVRAAHFNHPDEIMASRSGESGIPFHMPDLKRLKLDTVVIEPQSEENIEQYLSSVMRVPYRSERDKDGTTRKNSIHQLYSLLRLSEIFQQCGGPASFDAVFLLRPDLRYLDRLPLHQILDQLSGHDIVVPSWQSYKGLNDRFAFGTPEASLRYMTRIKDVGEFCETWNYYHAEELLSFSMQKSGMRVGVTDVMAQRIRSNGEVARNDANDTAPEKPAL